MKFRWLPLFFIALITSCSGHDSNEDFESEGNGSHSSTSKAKRDERKNENRSWKSDTLDEKELKELMGSRSENSETKVRDSILEVPAEGGPVRFVGRPDGEEDRAQYSYEGFNSSNGFHLVKGEFYENASYFLVDSMSGNIDTIWSEPIFSPNDSFLISPSYYPYGTLEGKPNGFQVWKLDQNREWVKLKEIDQGRWAATSYEWIDRWKFQVEKVTTEAVDKGDIRTAKRDTLVFEVK